MLVPLPEILRAHARRDTQPDPTASVSVGPVPAKDAATIAVVRDGDSGLEAFLMRRRSSMAFAAGMYVFPGGGVHEEDVEPLPWAGPDASFFASRLGCTPDTAHALVVAAARETFEETGVLLAGPDECVVVADTTPFHADREALERHEYSFAEFLHRHDLLLRADLLGAWAHWITPAFEPRRYDTRFFVSVLPEGQRIDTVSGEADRSRWTPISEVLSLVERGEAAMMLPTSTTCHELRGESAATVMEAAARREIHAIEPRIVEIDGELWLETGRS